MFVPDWMRDMHLRDRAAAYGIHPLTLMGLEAAAERPETVGLYTASAPAGELVGLPVLFEGADYLKILFASGSLAGSTGTISGETAPNNYATLQAVALQVTVGFTAESQVNSKTDNDDVALVTVLTSLTPDGGLNAFYGNQSVNAAGQQTGGDGFRRMTKRLSGLRENAILGHNRTMSLRGVVYQALDIVDDVAVTFEAQVLCRVLGDDELRRRS